MSIPVTLTKYLFLILMILFTLEDYTYFAKKTDKGKTRNLNLQVAIIYIFAMAGFGVVWFETQDLWALFLLAGILMYDAMALIFYRTLYPDGSMLLVNNMVMLLNIGFVMIARLDFEESVKQTIIAAAGTLLAFFVPVIIHRLKVLEKLKVLYCILGVGALLGVLALAATSGGAKLSISVGGISIQFSELVKITFVFYMASRLAKDSHFKSVAVTTVIAAVHVGILVLSTDLGTAMVFFAAYVVVIFVATGRPVYPLVALAGGSVAAVAAYFIFSHVRNRVTAFLDPFAVYNTSGYQIVQGLFGIGAGGWFGSGLYQGQPTLIPKVSKDFIFAAICEEFGAVFAVCLLLICMNMFLLIVNISMQLKKKFYKLLAIGIGAEYAIQVFLTVGGVTKFIPLTGITLPLVSYGGSSVICTILMIAIVEGLYILREDEGAFYGRRKKKAQKGR